MSKLGFFGTKARTMNVSRKPTVTVEQEFNKEILQRLGNFPIKVQLSILSDLLPELQAHQSRLIAENDRKKKMHLALWASQRKKNQPNLPLKLKSMGANRKQRKILNQSLKTKLIKPQRLREQTKSRERAN